MKARPRILVVGAGYVGLATAVFLAAKGHTVTVSEKRPETVDLLRRGRLHFREAELARRLKDTVASKRLTVDVPEPEIYRQADIIYIAIDSADRNTWRMRLEPFEEMAGWIGAVPRKTPPTVVLKSTNRLGFADEFRALLDDTPHGKKAKLLVNPEFLREGFAFEDTAKPWRIVVGSQNRKDAARLLMVYRTIYPKSVEIVHTDYRSAELIKLAANVYLAYRLSYIHEIADFSRREGLDIEAIRRGIGLDPRIGLDYFNPGLGFGGSCLPKDCMLINSEETDKPFTFESALAAMTINDRLLTNLVELLKDRLGSLQGKKIAILGAAFKPDVDDTRNSRAVELAKLLKRRRAKVAVFDPYLAGRAVIPETKIELVPDLNTALKGASAVVIGAAHRRFAMIKPKQTAGLVKRKLVIDYFRILNRKGWQDAGFELVW